MKKYKVGIIGATGMVGQRFITLLNNHPWFEVCVLAASSRSSGKEYKDVMENRWSMDCDIPENIKNLIIYDANKDIETITGLVDFVFCAVDMPKDDVKKLEEAYAKYECPVMSNNSANRDVSDVPMILPEINPQHCEIIENQKKRLGTKRGFIAVKSNCSIQSYVPAIAPLLDFGVNKVLACTYQSISGAGKTFEAFPEIVDNVIPFIGDEEQKSEQEPLKVLGYIQNGEIVNAVNLNITTQCFRVPVLDGHMAAVFVSFNKKPTIYEIKSRWESFKGEPQLFELPSAPKQFITYFEQENRPQSRLDRDNQNGMGISIGRLREDSQYDYKFVCLSHNTIRGAAGGAILMAELFVYKGLI